MMDLREILELASRQADEAELYALESQTNSIGFSNNKLKSINAAENSGVMLRIIKNGRIGQISSSNLDLLPRMIERALELAPHGNQVDFHFPAPEPLPELRLMHREEIDAWREADLVRAGEEIIAEYLAYDEGLLAGTGFDRETCRVRILNSQGLDHSFEKSTFSFYTGCQFVEAGNIIFSYQIHQGLKPCRERTALTREAIEMMRIARTTVAASGGSKVVLFTPRAMADIFICLEGGINAGNVAKGSSPLIGKIGEKLFDSRFTVYDDPLHPEGTESAPLDDEGIRHTTRAIIEKGILNYYVNDLKSAAQLKIAPTGNGLKLKTLIRSREFGVSPHPEFTNTVVEAGPESLSTIMSNIEDGLLVDSITGLLLGNLINGDFSGTIGMGYMIRNGELAGRVKDAMISGNFYDIFRDKLRAISRERRWTGTFGGSSGSYLMPHIAFNDIDIAVK